MEKLHSADFVTPNKGITRKELSEIDVLSRDAMLERVKWLANMEPRFQYER